MSSTLSREEFIILDETNVPEDKISDFFASSNLYKEISKFIEIREAKNLVMPEDRWILEDDPLMTHINILEDYDLHLSVLLKKCRVKRARGSFPRGEYIYILFDFWHQTVSGLTKTGFYYQNKMKNWLLGNTFLTTMLDPSSPSINKHLLSRIIDFFKYDSFSIDDRNLTITFYGCQILKKDHGDPLNHIYDKITINFLDKSIKKSFFQEEKYSDSDLNLSSDETLQIKEKTLYRMLKAYF